MVCDDHHGLGCGDSGFVYESDGSNRSRKYRNSVRLRRRLRRSFVQRQGISRNETLCAVYQFAIHFACFGSHRVRFQGFRGSKRYVPYINSQFILPVLILIVLGLLYYFNPTFLSDFFSLKPAEGETMFGAFTHKIPLIVYIILTGGLVITTLIKKLSLIPVLGLLLCAYLMTELGITNWVRFGIWLLVGLVIYFLYGMKHSNLNRQPETTTEN